MSSPPIGDAHLQVPRLFLAQLKSNNQLRRHANHQGPNSCAPENKNSLTRLTVGGGLHYGRLRRQISPDFFAVETFLSLLPTKTYLPLDFLPIFFLSVFTDEIFNMGPFFVGEC